jgi:predicted Zn-dependent protease
MAEQKKDEHGLDPEFVLQVIRGEVSYEELSGQKPNATPENIAGSIEYARMMYKEGKYGEAEMFLLSLRTLEPNQPDHLAGLAQLYLAQGRVEMVELALEQATRLNPDHPGARFISADLKLKNGDREGAVADLTKVTECTKKEWAHLVKNAQGRLALLTQPAASSDDEPEASDKPKRAKKKNAKSKK